MAKLIQPAFSRGELSPELHGRVDVNAHRTGLARARNCIVHPYGGISFRQGTHFVGPQKEHTYNARLIRFRFKATDQYMLEFGNQYMRVIRNGGYVVNSTKTITNITNASPAVVTATAHGFSNGDEVFIDSVAGMEEVNKNRYVIANVTANTFELTHQVDGTDIDSTGYSAYTSGGTASDIFELTTPYLQADDLFQINYTQSADTMTLVHPKYMPRELTRTDHNAWTLSVLRIGTDLNFPFNTAVSVGTPAAQTDRYRVTAVDLTTGEESLPGIDDATRTITSTTAANPVVVTATAHGYSNGDEVFFSGMTGMVELNGNRYYANNVTANTFEIQDRNGVDIDGTTWTAGTGGFVNATFKRITNGNVTRDNTITWDVVENTFSYNIYREKNGKFGFIGEATGLTFLDDNITPDTTLSPPEFVNPFDEVDSGTFPRAVGYYKQRRVFGGSDNEPDTSHFSQTANHSSFNVSRPTQADDAITVTLPSLEVNEIRHYIGLNDLITLTLGSEWIINSGPDSYFGPDTVNQAHQSQWGVSYRRPIQIGNSILFVSENQTDVRTFGYTFDIDKYDGINLNLLSRHLVQQNQIYDWAGTLTPESRVYMVGSKGIVMPMTYDREQEVIAWTWWDTGDCQGHKFESSESLRSGEDCQEDAVYFVVKRIIDGRTVRYIEVYRQLFYDDVRDCAFLDSYVSLDAPVTISGVSATNPVVITATAHGFSNGDEIDISDIVWECNTDANGNETQPDQLNYGRYLVDNVTANTFEITDEDGVPIDGSAFNAYVEDGVARKAYGFVGGLGHLEGETIKMLCDGNVVEDIVVTNSLATMGATHSRVHAGIPYIGEIETLNIENYNGQTIQGSDINIPRVTLRLYKSRGGWIGPEATDLQEIVWRDVDVDYSDPIPLLSGDIEQTIPSVWNSRGRVYMRMRDPLPFTLLAVVPTIEVGDDVH